MTLIQYAGFTDSQQSAVHRAMTELRDSGPRRIWDGETARSLHQLNDREAGFYAANPFILIRNDGWNIGCNQRVAKSMYELWSAEWVGFVIPGTMGDLPRPLSELPHALRKVIFPFAKPRLLECIEALNAGEDKPSNVLFIDGSGSFAADWYTVESQVAEVHATGLYDIFFFDDDGVVTYESKIPVGGGPGEEHLPMFLSKLISQPPFAFVLTDPFIQQQYLVPKERFKLIIHGEHGGGVQGDAKIYSD